MEIVENWQENYLHMFTREELQTLRIDGQDGFYVHINNDACTVLYTPKTPPPLQATVGQFITPTIPTKKRKK